VDLTRSGLQTVSGASNFGPFSTYYKGCMSGANHCSESTWSSAKRMEMAQRLLPGVKRNASILLQPDLV